MALWSYGTMLVMKNKVVLITGSSSGIGRETAYKFSAEKARVVVTFCNDELNGEKTYEKCRELGAADPLLVELDIQDSTSISHAMVKVIETYGRIDILINNAGVIKWKHLKDQSFADIEHQIRTNLEGLIKMTKFCLPHVKEMIINIASGAGQTGFAELTAYCATKFGVRGFTQALAEEVTNIKVYAVNPDMTATRMTDFQGRPPEQVARVILNTAKGMYNVPSGSDINVRDIYE
jgi:3-oxoacyl-[acyl-carrier protein] reductase